MTHGRTADPSWRTALENSLRPRSSGNLFKEGARRMAAGLNGQPESVTVTGRVRTSVLEFPGVAQQPIRAHQLYSDDEHRVAMVSDLLDYFEDPAQTSWQYRIDGGLERQIHRLHRESQGSESARLFVVIERRTSFSPVTFEDHQSYLVDEHQDGHPIIGGGREGERALLAIRTAGAPWPPPEPASHVASAVIAAVRIEHDMTAPLKELHGSSCLVSDEGRAVYTYSPSNSAKPDVLCSFSDAEISDKADRLTRMIGRMAADRDPVAGELFDSLVLPDDARDPELRLWYLRLWQAVSDARGRLNRPGLLNERDPIAGTSSPRDLAEYRNSIAHWHTGRIDRNILNDLQQTVMELARQRYR